MMTRPNIRTDILDASLLRCSGWVWLHDLGKRIAGARYTLRGMMVSLLYPGGRFDF